MIKREQRYGDRTSGPWQLPQDFPESSATFQLDVDGVVSHQVSTRQQLRRAGGAGPAGPVDFPDVVTLNAVSAEAELAHRVHVGDVLLWGKLSVRPLPEDHPSSCSMKKRLLTETETQFNT